MEEAKYNFKELVYNSVHLIRICSTKLVSMFTGPIEIVSTRGLDRNKQLIDLQKKVRKSIRKNPKNIYYATDKYEDSYEKYESLKTKTTQYASRRSKN